MSGLGVPRSGGTHLHFPCGRCDRHLVGWVVLPSASVSVSEVPVRGRNFCGFNLCVCGLVGGCSARSIGSGPRFRRFVSESKCRFNAEAITHRWVPCGTVSMGSKLTAARGLTKIRSLLCRFPCLWTCTLRGLAYYLFLRCSQQHMPWFALLLVVSGCTSPFRC